jgi:hypothetical protein
MAMEKKHPQWLLDLGMRIAGGGRPWMSASVTGAAAILFALFLLPAVKGLAARSRDDEAANPELLEQLTSVAQGAVLVVGIVAMLYAAVLLLLEPFSLGAWMSLPEAERERRVQARIDRIDRALERLGYAAPDVGHEPAAADEGGETTQ